MKGKLQFYDRRGTNNYSLKAQLMKNKPKECFEKNKELTDSGVIPAIARFGEASEVPAN
ncbi:hypothetical protein QUD55_08090 [Lactococcus lactis]|uniref:hypothetical protein n=1 Tax=Lactococcus lactis TaxID=1358 RepID=UPI0025A1DAFB|nr:hypothetical protein [Lactococcus lactis]MDM7537430.1 hypothetical protein [Lactococcus lactis]